MQDTALDQTDLYCLAAGLFCFSVITSLALLTSRLPRWQNWSMSLARFCYYWLVSLRWQADGLYAKTVKDLPVAQDALLSGLLIQVAAACAVVHDVQQNVRSVIDAI